MGLRHNADGTRGMHTLGNGKSHSAYGDINSTSYKYTPTVKKKSRIGLGSLIVGGLVAAVLFLKP